MGPCVIAENVCSCCILFAYELRANFLQDCFMERREFLKKAAATTVVTSLSAKLLRCATDSFPYRWGTRERKFPSWGLAVITSAGDRKEALLSASKQRKIRYIGFTGHKSPDIHLKMLQTAFAHQFTFDSLQCHEPANQRGHYRVRIACNSSAGARGCRKLQSHGQG